MLAVFSKRSTPFVSSAEKMMNMGKEKSGAVIGSLLKEGVDKGVYPGAVLLVAQKNEIVFF